MAYGDYCLSSFAKEWSISERDARELFERYDLPIAQVDGVAVVKIWHAQGAANMLMGERHAAEMASKAAK